ncbi:MAG: substrate-binding domain-containing protein [Phocaeicola sp.]
MKINQWILTFLCLIMLLLCDSCTHKEHQFFIGVSQCSEDEWRGQMNKEIKREVLFYPGTQLEIRTAKDNNLHQIEDIKYFIHKKVDLLIVAPNEADAITPVIEQAFDAGIPVVLVDRKIRSNKYTAYVGANNYEIGKQVGNYIINRLHGKGNIIEITGLHGSTPAVERHKGMMESLKNAPEIKIIASADAGWFKDKAENLLDSILAHHMDIDLVFAQNDRMAIGAFQAAAAQGREKDILFVGIDAVAGKGFGIESVAGGEMDATFIYPTGGDNVVQTAMAILQGKPYDKEINLSTALVDKSNARIMQMQTEHISQLDYKIELLNGQLDAYFMRYSAQRMFLYACILILVLTATLLVFVVRAFWIKNRMNTELSKQKAQLETQRDQLIDLSRQLEEATHAKLSFFTNVSHDFRTPLTLIADPINQLMESNHCTPQEQTLLNVVHKNVTILLRLINQILDFRKFENGKLEINFSQFNAAQSICEWAESFRSLSYRKHIHFNITVTEHTEEYVLTADAEKLERILYNLLSNAFKFTPENGQIEIILSTFRREDSPWLKLSVSDTGKGMSPEHIQHIFERFYQIDIHHTGSGIGLALAKAFTEMHHGQIRVESIKDKGTTFIVEIPMTQPDFHNEQATNKIIPESLKEGAVLDADSNMGSSESEENTDENLPTVLIIDDNQDVRNYIRFLLQQQYDIVEAENGLEGVKLALKYVPDAIICDVMMPVMDGMECCRKLKTEMQTSHIPVIMLTAYTMDEQKIKGYECGADSYLTKPFNGKILKARLQNLIENHLRLQNFFTDQTGMTSKPQLNEADKGFVDKLRKEIEERLSNPDTNVENLGAALGFSRVQLYRKTKALTGYAPNELLRIARLKKAASLLAATEKSIAEVTYEVGFSSPSYFTRCFKEFFGESPTDYLKRIR